MRTDLGGARAIGFTRRGVQLAVFVLMFAFAAWFSAYSVRQHDAHLTYKSDLGQIDQAIWNTAHGRLLQEVKEDRLSTRLTDHVEPLFAPLSLVFRLWDDVRALLVLQAVMLAAGAWPLFLFARKRLSDVGCTVCADWGGLVFGAAYLLSPGLDAAAVAEFHALPLAAPLIAAAIWAIERRRWGWLAATGMLLASVQEGAALIAAGLGLYGIIRLLVAGRRPSRSDFGQAQGAAPGMGRGPDVAPRSRVAGLLVSGAMVLLGLAWFYVATFVIIPHFAAEAYALDQTPYAARYGSLGDSFSDVLVTLITRPGEVLGIAAEPLRLRYLAILLLPTAGLALLGPELLLAGLPLLLANLLSSYPLQYSGALHYTAPLIPIFVAAAAIGAARLLKWGMGRTAAPQLRRRLPPLVLGTVAVCAIGCQVAAGFTPAGREFWRTTPKGWPVVTAHERLLDRFVRQIPADSGVATTPSLHPHLSHRERIYLFPVVANAEFVLVDVTEVTHAHPNDVKHALDRLLASGDFGVLDAADGYLLLQRGGGEPTDALPDAFADFARAKADPAHPLHASFGEVLVLVGYDVVDDPKWRRTAFRFYWEVTGALFDDCTVEYRVVSPAGKVVDDSTARPIPALLWHPPARWKAGETIVIETEPWFLPQAWAPVLSVLQGGRPLAPEIAETGNEAAAETLDVAATDVALRLPAWTRRDGRLVPFDGPLGAMRRAAARFVGGDWTAQLLSWSAPRSVAPGQALPITLGWAATGHATRDYSVLLHLRDAAGRTVAVGDAGPTWFLPRPSRGWPAAGEGAIGAWDAHVLDVPPELPDGRYELVTGLYEWDTGVRLPVVKEPGNAVADEIVLGAVMVDGAAAQMPDACCLLASECCASLEY